MNVKHTTSEINIGYEMERLLAFAGKSGLIEEADVIPSRNALLALFGLDEPIPFEGSVSEADVPDSAVPILENLLDYAADTGLLPHNNGTYRDLLDAQIMGLLMPRASETNRRFWELARGESAAKATDYFYKQSVASNYIRLDRVAKNIYWETETPYGNLEITVNLSKPEKNPQEIALLKNAPSSSYPKCLLCDDNVGYAGRLNHPGRQNHRIVPLTLTGENWFLQYSPYVYYNEHSIVLKEEHMPMVISPASIRRLVEFIEQFPHYFVGSNADLPIVGGSILNHDHFQAGRHQFAMEKAPIDAEFTYTAYPKVKAGIVAWPLSVIRLRSRDKEQLLGAAEHILASWRAYSDHECDIWSHSDTNGVQVPHNTITPIARYNADGELELDLVLRNNRTSDEHPGGIFHPHNHLHHIKQENIGLIEVMGLAVLPGRLKEELSDIALFLTGSVVYDAQAVNAEEHSLHKHASWIEGLIREHGTTMTADAAEALLQREVGAKFLEVLLDSGVYKRDSNGAAGFRRFLNAIGYAVAT
jgi:UDPglucose--hexose-1-phosphate uridylyltransferase